MVAACSVPIEAIGAATTELRESFNSGKTRSLQWRLAQLKAMERMLKDGRKALCDALYSDLRKNLWEGYLTEISTLEKELQVRCGYIAFDSTRMPFSLTR